MIGQLPSRRFLAKPKTPPQNAKKACRPLQSRKPWVFRVVNASRSLRRLGLSLSASLDHGAFGAQIMAHGRKACHARGHRLESSPYNTILE
jgi:hypothetical protein